MSEQEVRTRAGWIGVEISKSRVRTPGRPGYGLYRVWAAAERHWHVPHPVIVPAGEWTAYAFTLQEIERAVGAAIECGTPAGPQALGPRDALTGETVSVPTRWTSRYRGRRDLGVAAEVDGPYPAPPLRQEAIDELNALAALVGAGFGMDHEPGCTCDPPGRFDMACVRLTMRTPPAMTPSLGERPHGPEGCHMGGQPHLGPCCGPQVPEGERGHAPDCSCGRCVRRRQRVFNGQFQAEHAQRRAAGLRARHRGRGGELK